MSEGVDISDPSKVTFTGLTLEPAFRITPAGAYEAAFLRFLHDYTHPQLRDISDGYYGSLMRRTPAGIQDRIATMAVIAEEVWLASFDWIVRSSEDAPITNQTFRSRQLGIGFSYLGLGEWDDDLVKFVGMLLKAGAIPKGDLVRLAASTRRNRQTHRVNGIGEFEYTSFQALCRLLNSTYTSGLLRTVLLLSQEDRITLAHIAQFVTDHRWPTPFDLPDLATAGVTEGDAPLLGLLLFSPPDYRAMLAVRRNSRVITYAKRVREAAFSPDGHFDEARLVKAMAEASMSAERTARAIGVFEAESWVLRGCSFIPVLDKIAAFADVVREGCLRWMKRRKVVEDWRLIGPHMQTIAIENYLQRKGNL